uniref:Uncharacterized protein n=1 Tax=Pristionchus pacificus TaxID=54126 RepID=A0A8R1V6M9_PRIPA
MSCGDRKKVFLYSGVRTPIGSFRGSLSTASSVELGATAAREAIKRSGLDASAISEVVVGSVLTAGVGQSVGRQVAIAAGVPKTVSAFTINKVCSSSMKALQLAYSSILLGDSAHSLVVGTESMSRVPFYMQRGEIPYGGTAMVDGVVRDGLEDAMLHEPMGVCAEKSAKDYGISRQESDAYAIGSYKKAAEAWSAGKFKDEVIPMVIRGRRGEEVKIEEDEEYKKLIESKVPSLSPVFIKDGTGTITAANASSLNDGAVAAVISASLPLPPLAEIVCFAEVAGEPVDFTVIPVVAVKKLLEKTGLDVGAISLWEVNEAFSVTVLAFIKALGVDATRVNVKGGAVSLGHPLGMSGLRVVVSLAHSLERDQLGVAAICNGGGEAVAVLLRGC